MTQVYYRANLNDDEFPLVSSFQSRTVIQPQIDQNYVASQTLVEKSPVDKGIPECYYMHNVLPSAHGYKTVAYRTVVTGIYGKVFTQRFQVEDFNGNRGLIGITADGHTYLAINTSSVWLDITPPGQPICDVTVAHATGSSFICYANWGIYALDLVTKTLSTAGLLFDSPMVDSDVVGIGSSTNYLLLHDGSKIYWSSALNVLDFKKSQITGAGSGTPQDVIGTIIRINKLNVGFAIYCQGNIVVATYSGNTQYPWTFKEAPNSSGISSIDAVTSGDDGSNYAWTSSGLMKVTLAGCSLVHTQVSDFIGGNIIEDFDSVTNTFNVTYTEDILKYKIAFLSSRYLAISYGVTDLQYSLIYDIPLKRWGKLKVPHSGLIDIGFKPLLGHSNPTYLTYDQLGTVSYDQLGVFYPTYNDMVSLAVQAPDVKHNMTVIGIDGEVKLISTEFGDTTSDSVLLMGKYQMFRANVVTLQGASVEVIDEDNANFSLTVLTSLDGKNTGLVTNPYEIAAPGIRGYNCLVTGQNHSLLFKGSFHMAGLILIFTNAGNR
jgi:hypothetical protein